MLKFQDTMKVKSKQENAMFRSHSREEARCLHVLANYPARTPVNMKGLKYLAQFMDMIRTSSEKHCYREAL